MNFDNKESIENYVHDFQTLHEVMDYRYNQGYNLNKRMSDFTIFNGRIRFDTCGNSMIRTELGLTYDTYSFKPIPNGKDVCPYCGKPFSIYKLDDIFTNYKGIHYHKICNTYNNLNIAIKDFKDIFSKVYDLQEISFKVIPNQYDNWEGYEPWFIVTTSDGDIQIGWRKRVISIEWLNDYKQFTERFEDENVTKEFNNGKRLIHAWSEDKCIEYLTRAKNSINN